NRWASQASCFRAADKKYKETWEAVCAGLAREAAAGLFLFQRPGCCKGYCTEFTGSPRIPIQVPSSKNSPSTLDFLQATGQFSVKSPQQMCIPTSIWN